MSLFFKVLRRYMQQSISGPRQIFENKVFKKLLMIWTDETSRTISNISKAAFHNFYLFVY